MINIMLVSKYKKINLKNNFVWCYIGKNYDLKDKIQEYAGLENRLFLDGRLHGIAGELRRPYLDYIANMASLHGGSTDWWATCFSSKSPFLTDFYLLLCYKALIKRLIGEYMGSDRELFIFIEDPWLLDDLKKEYKVDKEIRYTKDNFCKTKMILYFLVRGISYRVGLAAYLITSKVLLRKKHFYPETGRPDTIGIISFAEERSFNQDRFNDPYTGELDRFLEKNGYKVFRPLFINAPISLVKKIIRLRKTMWPLIIDFKLRDLLKIFKIWRPDSGLNCISDIDVRALIKREAYAEFSKAGYNRCLILHEIMVRFFNRNLCSKVIYFFENQPWEKIVCSAAKGKGINIIGYQHSTIPFFLMMYFLGRGEEKLVPLPDKVIANGKLNLEMLVREGYPEDKLVNGGTWRYGYLNNSITKINRSGPPRLFFILPANKSLVRMIEKYIKILLQEDLCAEYWVKHHPDVSLSAYGVNFGPPVKVVNEPINNVLEQVDIVIASGTPNVEALVYGKTVIRIIPESIIDLDPLAGLNVAEVVECFESTFIKTVKMIVLTYSGDRVNLVRENVFFSNVDEDVWLREMKIP